ncbi:hypothetical protein [Dysgonomonas sp. 520]|uniref:hypothetical protein n=1 Tax=Dysgonomonas sp. 520 TaxID=2302931 RepID=UPI0013D859DC|nr:hypothetical protein [Dysgonomonas sp. 520]NDW09574.1 hypothetical protein [Dysgonomonas sp. 520]
MTKFLFTKSLQIAALLLIVVCFSSCSDGVKDVPDYAKGEYKPYFVPYGDNQTSFYGELEGVSRQFKVNGFTYNGRPYRGLNVLLDGQPVGLIYTNDMSIFSGGISIEQYAGSSYIITALIDKDENGNATSKNFYFFEIEKYDEAVEYLKNLKKAKNRESKYKGEFRTYNSKIGKSVIYTGFQNAERKDFASLYLECGAVVQLFDKEVLYEDLVGKNIDCTVMMASNDVMDFTITE